MRILMTGSHGFVGTNLIEVLSTEHEIIPWNVRENFVIPEVDAIIHLAALVHDTKHTNKEEEYFRVNTLMTKRLYDRFLESSARKFIFFSSIMAQDSKTPYGISKREAEIVISKKEEERIKKKKEVYILRPCMIHGKGNKGNLNLLVKILKKGIPWPLAAFENKRSFVSMENVAYVVSELLKKDVESGTYNISDDEAISTNELIELICKSMGKDAHLWRVPQGLMKCIAKIGDTLHLFFNSERLGKLTEDYIIDNTKIKHVLDIERMPIRAREGLQQTIQSMINDNGK